MPDEQPIFAEIAALLEDHPRVALAELEHTLTAGYAAAMQLEAERWRIERRIADVTSRFVEAGAKGRTRELTKLARRLQSADGELARLRAMLDELRDLTLAARAVA